MKKERKGNNHSHFFVSACLFLKKGKKTEFIFMIADDGDDHDDDCVENTFPCFVHTQVTIFNFGMQAGSNVSEGQTEMDLS